METGDCSLDVGATTFCCEGRGGRHTEIVKYPSRRREGYVPPRPCGRKEKLSEVEKEVDSLQEECLCAAPCVLQRRFVGELFPLDIRFALLLARIVLKTLAVMESSLHNKIRGFRPSDVT